MATIDEVNEQLTKITEQIDNVSNVLSGVATKIGSSFGDLVDKSKDVVKSLGDQAEATENVTKATEKLTNANVKGERARASVAKDTENLTEVVSLAAGAFINLGGIVSNSFGKSMGIGSESAKQLKQDISSLDSLVKKFGSSGNPMASMLGGIAGLFTGTAVNLSTSTAGIKEFENSLTSTLGKFAGFGEEGNRIDFTKNIESQLVSFVEQNNNVAKSLNLSIDEINDYSQSLLQVPGAYNKVVEAGTGANKSMTLFEAAIKTGRGTTGDFKDSLAAITTQFELFKQSDEKALDLMSRTYQLSQKLGIGFREMDTMVGGVVEKFATFGNNMQSSIGYVGGLMRAFQDTGLGFKPAKEMLDGITNSIYGMDTAQKAFLSSQTGGSGGLRGAFEVDMMMREGNMGEVYKKMEQSLRQQFGGGVVTLEEGAQSDTAAAQLEKQKQFLMSGPFGGIVKSEDQAYRLLEAFEKSGLGGIDIDALSESTSGALSEALTVSDEMQSKQVDILTSVSNNIKTLVLEAQISNAVNLREGAKDININEILNKYKESARSASITGIEGFGNSRENAATKINSNLTETAGLGGDLLKQIGEVDNYLKKKTLKDNGVFSNPGIPDEERRKEVNLPGDSKNSQVANQMIGFKPLDIRISIDDGTGKIKNVIKQADLDEASGFQD
jgi:ABC-type transporter Mla subunit MlaD